MADKITIHIDGQEVQTEPGKMVLEAAIDAGIYIPYLCYHPGMKPFGACRTCVVSVVDGRGMPASCTLPVQDGMEINSNVPEVNDLRKSIMSMMIAEHPNGCLTCHRIDICGPSDVCLRHVDVNDRCITCPKNERCEFKDTVRYLGMELESHLDYNYKSLPLDLKDPFYDRDYNLCITCGRCVRVCEEVRGDSAIAFIDRGGKALVGTSFGSSLLESGCEFCGACLDVCPVGALVEKENKWEKPREVKKTVCTQCPVGCQLNLELNDFGRMIRVVPELDSPVNHGQGCYRSKFGLDYLNSTSRIRHPQIRKNGQLENVSWDEAIAYICDKWSKGSKSEFSLLTASDNTNEELYLWQKLVRSYMGTNNIDQSTNLKPKLTEAMQITLGIGAGTGSIWDLTDSEACLVFNSNITEEHTLVSLPIKKARKSGAKIVVLDSRETEMTRHSDLWLRPYPGTENLVLLGIMKIMLSDGLISKQELEERIDNSDDLIEFVESLDLKNISMKSKVTEEALNSAANLLSKSEKTSIIYSLDTISYEQSDEIVGHLVNISLITDSLGKKGGGIYPMRQGGNEQGAQDMGSLHRRLPDGVVIADTENPGIGLNKLEDSITNGNISSMLVIGELLNESHPIINGLKNKLKDLEFLVTLESYPSDLTDDADVVLPRFTFAEKTGTYTNLERRIQKIVPAMELKNNESISEIELITRMSDILQIDGLSFDSEASVMEEIASVVSSYQGISYDLIDKNVQLVFRSGYDMPKPTQELYTSYKSLGVQWPLNEEHNSTERLFETRPKLSANINQSFEDVSTDECFLVQGRVLFMDNDLFSISEEDNHNVIHRPDVFELNTESAETMKIENGDKVTLQTDEYTADGTIRINNELPDGVIAHTSLFGELAVALQNNDKINQMADVPKLRILPASLNKKR
tara:strand:- start:1453 stop:4212 length:2760 start_codon:yes stop_codon:yes gene_type:complete